MPSRVPHRQYDGAMVNDQQEEERVFEEEVLRVARALWGKERPFQGSQMLDGAERDGVFVGHDVVALVEATVSRRLDKAKKDGDKLKSACDTFVKKYPMKAVKGYFVTRDEPTAEQRQYITRLNSGIAALSFAQLRGLLIDSREYLTVRSSYPFGSARNPLTGDVEDLGKYLPLGLLPMNADGRAKPLSVAEISSRTAAGQTTILLGDFGAGKSMTLREVHRTLAEAHLKDATKPFPISLNLRDHQGQRDPDEALRRHAQAVGFDGATQLVRAWRAGGVYLLLDGFDEIATSGWLGQAPTLKNVRYRSVELIRKFVDQTPPTVGLLVSGREHLFDSPTEMLSALGVNSRKPIILRTDEFSDAQVGDYLKQSGWEGNLPDWMPSRPLLLGYLAASGALSSLVSDDPVGAAEGWDTLLERICEREAGIELGLDGSTVRRVLERLATIARTRGDGFGPLHRDDLAEGFKQVCGYEVDEGSYVIIQRMPGLGVVDPVDGSRHFVDADLGEAARAGDLVRIIQNPGLAEELGLDYMSLAPIGELGLDVAELEANREGMDASSAVNAAVQLERGGKHGAMVLDCVSLALKLGVKARIPSLQISELAVSQLRFGDSDADLGQLQFQQCVITTLDLTEFDGNHELPTFVDCAFGQVLGAGSPDSLPKDAFINCSYDSFDASTRTTRGIMAMPGLSDRQKVVLSILKKVYMQAGGGRREGAFARGLDPKQRGLVSDVLKELTSEGMLVRSKAGNYVIYAGVRGQASRARDMLSAGAAVTDSLLINMK